MRWVIVSVYAAALVVATLVPWNHPGRTVPRIDMALHFVAWTVLAFLTAIAWAKSRAPIGAAALAALAAVCFGALIEVLQPRPPRLPCGAVGRWPGAGAAPDSVARVSERTFWSAFARWRCHGRRTRPRIEPAVTCGPRTRAPLFRYSEEGGSCRTRSW